MLFNAISWTTGGRVVDARPHEDGRPLARFRSNRTSRSRALQVLNVVGVPLAFMAFGVVRWRVRNARRQGQKL